MRRKYFGWAIAAVALLGPQGAWAGDREIAQQIIERLKTHRDSGALKEFTLDMKVDQGVVLLRGNVSQDRQKDLVLAAADGIEGVKNVVDEVSVSSIQPSTASAKPAVEKQGAFDMSAALSATAPQIESAIELETQAIVEPAAALRQTGSTTQVDPMITQVAAYESATDDALVNKVLGVLGEAQRSGELKGFGLDVQSDNGIVLLTGQARSEAQRERIIALVRSVPGVSEIHESIDLATPSAAPTLEPMPSTGTPAKMVSAPTTMAASPMPVMPKPAKVASAKNDRQAVVQAVPYRTHSVQAQTASAPMMGAPMMGAPMMGAPIGMSGTPVPMAPYTAVGAPRYDTPNLPNYAWPGYAAHPNYAAVTYPQQYSPSAYPYIGPFYPYPQVPLGWRKVSLEWDDGWWFLDFTDRDY
jgi:osmotically-inducible protein OsmY